MSSTHRIPLKLPQINTEKLGFFRFGHFEDSSLLTNDAGEWTFLSQEAFGSLIRGEITSDHPNYPELQSKGFIREGMDLEGLASRVKRKKSFLGQGPHLHIVITSLRCNQGCKYCHASRANMDRPHVDMSIETARGVVDLAMQSTSPYICFEYTGGEPVVNMDAVREIIQYSKEKNKDNKKIVEHSIVTNMTYMTQEIADFLIDNDVWVCTSLDGPRDLHDWNRFWKKGESAYDSVIKWISYFNQRYISLGKDPELYHVDALMTTTSKTFANGKALIDLYVDLGIRNIHLRPLNPFGFAPKTWKVIGYSIEEYMAFYEECLDYIIELNVQGVEIMEGTASNFLKKILTPYDPNFVDIRSPIGSGTGQLAYNYNGKIYPSDEGRMVSAMGDEFFVLGEVGKSSYEDLVNHPTVKTLAMSSILDTLPSCSTCWNAPYCGVRPLHNYMNNKDLFAQRPVTLKCKEHMKISELLFTRLLHDKDGTIRKMFNRWILDRPRQQE